MNNESLIKGRIAEYIVELLLEENGYKVVRIGQDGLLSPVIRKDTKKLNKADSAGKITTAPSYAVFDSKGTSVVLTKIKFKSEKSKGGNIAHGLGQLQKYWPEAKLVVVSSKAPYFLIFQTSKEEPIEVIFTQIKKQSLKDFERVVKKFFK